MEKSIEIYGDECKKYAKGESYLILFEDYLYIHPFKLNLKHWKEIKKHRTTIFPRSKLFMSEITKYNFSCSIGVILYFSGLRLSKRHKHAYLRQFEASIDSFLLKCFKDALKAYVIERTDIFEAALANSGEYPFYKLCKFYCKKKEIHFRSKSLNSNFSYRNIPFDIELEEDLSDYEKDCDDEELSSD
mgnify:CR=1 FL=1